MPPMLARTAVILAALAPFAACHGAKAADVPKSVTPTVDIEVEDRGPDRVSHLARFSIVAMDGKAEVFAHDGDTKYELAAHAFNAPEPRVRVDLKRGGGERAAEIDIKSALPQQGGRVLLAKIDRADGRTTTVVAQVR